MTNHASYNLDYMSDLRNIELFLHDWEFGYSRELKIVNRGTCELKRLEIVLFMFEILRPKVDMDIL